MSAAHEGEQRPDEPGIDLLQRVDVGAARVAGHDEECLPPDERRAAILSKEEIGGEPRVSAVTA